MRVPVALVSTGLGPGLGLSSSPSIPADVMLYPLTIRDVGGIPVRLIGISLGWVAAMSIYVSLAFMTFLYPWRK